MSDAKRSESQPVFVTQPNLPPLEELIPYLEAIWDNKILTNNGPFHEELESQLANYLGVKEVVLFSNGTIALLTALRALGITGKVITTPYTFVATAHALLWNNIEPVFVDIDPKTLNLDANQVQAALSDDVSALLPVHCYGTPCDVDAIQQIADSHNLKVIYDAAHAFGVNYRGQSLLNHGDLSVLSFHATKVFNTFEGGAIICHDPETKKQLKDLKNFGFQDEVTVSSVGINGKMNEFCAAFGLLQLKEIDQAIAQRQQLARLYNSLLQDLPGIRLLEEIPHCTGNASYFPIFVGEEAAISRDALYHQLIDNGFRGRRYFYPLVSEMPMYRHLVNTADTPLTCATRASREVICLPLFPTLEPAQVRSICKIIQRACRPT